VRSKTPGRNDVDADAQEPLQVLDESDLIDERGLRLEVDEEIDVALGSGVAPGDGTEHADMRGAPTMRGGKDLLTSGSERLERGHNPRLRRPLAGHGG